MTQVQYRYFALGRHAMKVALELSGVTNGDRVMIPRLICRELLASLSEIGAQAFFYDVDLNLNPIELNTAIQPKAIIAVNYFGFPQNLEPFKKIQASSGAQIIEDNAHGFLSLDEYGQELGTRTALGITSFRKTLLVSDGATLTIQTNYKAQSIPDQITLRTTSFDYHALILKMLTSMDRKMNIPILNTARSISNVLGHRPTNSSLSSFNQNIETRIPGPANPRQSSIKIMKSFNGEKEINRRRNLYNQLLPEVKRIGAIPIYGSLPVGVSPYGLAIYAKPEMKQALDGLAHKFHITLGPWPDLPHSDQQNEPIHYRSIWLLYFR